MVLPLRNSVQDTCKAFGAILKSESFLCLWGILESRTLSLKKGHWSHLLSAAFFLLFSLTLAKSTGFHHLRRLFFSYHFKNGLGLNPYPPFLLFFPYKCKITIFYRSLGILTYEIKGQGPWCSHQTKLNTGFERMKPK